MDEPRVVVDRTVEIPRILVAVVLDQDTAAVHWPELEPLLLAQECDPFWDLLVVDVSEEQSPNYSGWLKSLEKRWPFNYGKPGGCRVRRLSLPERGIRTAFSDRGLQFDRGSDKAYECFCRWTSYGALWLLRCDARPDPQELQDRWHGDGLIRLRPEVEKAQVVDLVQHPDEALTAAAAMMGQPAAEPTPPAS